ncbi:phage/plasmid primase, P4 family [Micromonospora chokoriensis]
MTLAEFLTRLAATEDGDGWVAPCPAHADSHPSLRVAVGERGVLLKCRAGCTTTAVLTALGMTFADLAALDVGDVPTRARSTSTPANPAAVAALAAQLDGFTYRFAIDGESSGAVAYTADRFGLGIDDAQRLGLGLALDLGGGPRLVVPFRDQAGVPRGYQARALDPRARIRWLGAKSPEGESWSRLAWFPAETGWAEVIVTEGPGDGLTACAVGYDTIAVRGAGLAASVADEVAGMVGDRPAVIVGDADPSGDNFARTLAAELAKRGVSARKVRPPTDGDDLTDWRGRAPETFASDFVRAVQSAQDPGGLATRLAVWTDADLTDVAAAYRLKAHFEGSGSGVRFSPEAGFFLLADGVWRPDKLDGVRTHAQAVARSVWDEAAALSEALAEVEASGDPGAEAKALKAQVGKLRAFARHVNSSRGIDAMVRELQAAAGVAVDITDFDRHHHLLACRNGVVDLRTGALGPHDPAYLLTRRIDLDYDPEAHAPRWLRFLDEVFPDHPDLPAYMRRLVGYGITGETSEQCFAVLWGKGANGKSVFTDTLTEVFREATVTTPFATFEEKPSGGIPNDVAALKGARMVMASEGDAGKPMAEALLKRVTGRDLISARFMRREFFEFRPTFLLLLATNTKPAFRGQDEGLWRRVKLIPWLRFFKPTERDGKLGLKLLGEAAGIFAWAVRGAVEWYRGGLQDPPAIVGATAEYRQTSDALTGFVPGQYVIDGTGRTDGKTLFDAYLTWADEENLPQRERWKRTTFYGALEERGATKRKTAKGVAFDGIHRVRAVDAVPDHDAPEVDEVACTPSSPLAHTKGVEIPTSGPSLDDVL